MTRPLRRIAAFILVSAAWLSADAPSSAVESAAETDGPPQSALDRHWLWSRAYAVPEETTSEQSGYFSIIEGKNKKIYIGTAKYGANAYLVEFDPATKRMTTVMDAQKEIGTTATGFSAQAKLHTRNNVGASGRIYVGTKQGYPKMGETPLAYPGGYPLVYDPATGKTKTYPIPIPHQGIISVTPDESRDIAYVSTCSDERPIESSHFLTLDLKTGKYRDLMDTRHMYAFIVVDHLGRAYHPILGGEIARYDPRSQTLDRLKPTIDGQPPSSESLLAHPESHPINWDISPDRKTLYAVAMSGNQLYSYDLSGDGTGAGTLAGKRLGPLIAGAKATDCRAMCVGPDGTVWAGVAATFPKAGQLLHLVRYRPGDSAPQDLGPVAIGNPDYTTFKGSDGKDKPYHHGVYRLNDGTLLPRYVIMGIAAASDDTVYLTTLYPFTVHAVRVPKVAAIVTAYHHNSHADVILSRVMQTDTLDGKGKTPSIELTSVHTDQVPDSDISRRLAREHGLRLFDNPAAALTQGSGKFTADGVMLIAEHGRYPKSDTDQIIYPKRRLFAEILKVIDQSGRIVPVFSDKHLADNWTDAKWIYDEAKRRGIPMMAGSSVPGLWRYPPKDVRKGAKLARILVVSYGPLDAYGFHALEVLQALAERRAGGETGIRAVQCLSGPEVWRAERDGVFERPMLDAALSRLKERPLPAGKKIEDLVPDPVLYVIDYHDGLRGCVLTLNHAVSEWSASWRYDEKEATAIESTLFWTQEARPFAHFSFLLMGIERMMHTGRPTWPLERTLLTTGALDAALTSRRDGGKRLETPWLRVSYQSDWNWTEPPPPPPSRPIPGQ